MVSIIDVRYWLPWGIIALAVAAGLIAELIALPRLIARAGGRHPAAYRFVLSTMRGVLALWALAAGIDVALLFTALPPRTDLYLHRAILFISILSTTLVAVRVAVAFVEHWVSTIGHSRQSLTLFNNLTAVLIAALGLLVALQSIGISVTPLLTALGVGGLAVALALQDTLANFFAGIHIIVSRRLRPGDSIRLQSGESGTVVDITWRNTLVRDRSNSIVVVPNNKVAQTIFTNYDQPSRPYSFEVTFKVAYENDLELVERSTLEIAQAIVAELPEADPSAHPTVRFQAFEDAGIITTVTIGARSFDSHGPVKHELIKRLHRHLHGEGDEWVYPFHAAPEPARNGGSRRA
ncbi:mechanosensitive ion channel family protein [bacterium]|nr:MAG: mechanosensitive ion channel family protein [bacterium]